MRRKRKNAEWSQTATVLVLFGGCSPEHEVSLESASAVLRAIDRERYAVVPVWISREGDWFFLSGEVDGDDLAKALARGAREEVGAVPAAFSPSRSAPELLLFRNPSGAPERIPIDLALPVLHGRNGEDGTVQGLLELAGVPIAGCGTLASALCMDKDRAHRMAASAGVRVPRGAVIRGGTEARREAERAAGEIGYPVFVKPVGAGSSFGISRVERPEDLPAALVEVFRYDRDVILEEAVSGCEIGCAVMGWETIVTGVPDEIELAGPDGFFDFREKYGLITSRIHVPARIPEKKREEIRSAAETVYRALGCEGFARVDFFLTPEGEVVFNEANTIPGFTEHSRFPGMMRAAGHSFAEVVEFLLEGARRERTPFPLGGVKGEDR